jgi:hypothetical protein
MSAASPARSQVREPAPSVSAPSRAATNAAAAPLKEQRPAFGFAAADAEQHFKLNLSDIPRVPYTMDVEGLKPSLLARLVGLVSRSK